MLVPIRITRSIAVIDERKNQSFVSTVFFATFADRTSRMLRLAEWTLTDLLKPGEIGSKNETYLPEDVCPLYYCDWTNVPIFGDFKKHYPTPLRYVSPNG